MSDDLGAPAVRPARPDDLDAVVAVLAPAFQDDPVMRWLLPDDDDRRAALPALMRTYAETFLAPGSSWLLADGRAVALWTPAGVPAVPEERTEAFRAGVRAALGPHVARSRELGARLREHVPEAPHVHLHLLGVLPPEQGLGLGSALLAPGLAASDAAGEPAYLEATSPGSRALYLRHGFRVVGEVALPDGPSLWPMWRDPGGAP